MAQRTLNHFNSHPLFKHIDIYSVSESLLGYKTKSGLRFVGRNSGLRLLSTWVIFKTNHTGAAQWPLTQGATNPQNLDLSPNLPELPFAHLQEWSLPA